MVLARGCRNLQPVDSRSVIKQVIPLADQLRRRPAKPQRLVQFQHGIPTSIGVERYTPVFQIGIRGAIPRCSTISARSLKVRRLLREQDQAGALPAALTILRDANTGAGQDVTGLAAAVQLRLRVADRVASIAAMQRSLKPKSTGQHRGDPPFRIRGEITIILRFERRVCRWESGRMHQFQRRVSPNRRGVPLRPGRLKVRILHALPSSVALRQQLP